MIRPSRFLGARFFRPFYHPQRFYPVLFGPLRGLQLRFGPQVTVRELLGFWERNNFAAIMRLRDAGFLGSAHPVMYDIGANFGLYSLLFSSLLGPQGRVFAFEPGDAPRALMIDNLTWKTWWWRISPVLIRLAQPSSISRKIMIIRHRCA